MSPSERTPESGAACWCCGEPAPIRGEGDPWEGQLDGYCESCASTRCDTTDSTCAVKRSAAYVSRRKPDESAEHHALREILLVESGRSIRHNMTDEEMWQRMTYIARAALNEARNG